MNKRRYVFSAFFYLSFSLAARAEEQIVVGLNIPQTVVDGSIYSAADKLGYFRAENLAVKTIVFQGAGALLPQVNSKKIDIGFPMPEPVLASYAAGKKPLPVQFFYNARPSGGMELAVLDGSPIKSLADLKGKKIGVGALTWASIPQTRAVLASQGLNPDQDVQIVATGALGAGFLALKEGRVDALNFNQSWHDMLEQSGTKIRRLSYPPEFAAMVGNGFIAHNDTLRDRRAMLVGFGRAITKATLACEANPAFCVQTFWRAQPELKPAAGVYQAKLKESVFLLERRLKRTLYTPEGQPVVPGQYDTGAIARYVTLMHNAGELDTASVPLDNIFTNALVNDINDFDKQAVRQQARVAKLEEN
ncbi:ABC transporter substrate-binding protein [Acerihabitans arboris]|uniref:PhnD/SsuA/transferrin family substrate-binding protein n=1 Tax=Acerihabitans arboris TaxID=2691583 RepID=A0A845SJS2_9GAMM|nr:ABC transporter substrate-binding protein [Acerihabitans arboris]NDL65483.1 PhnD/SsuA/transferrin family substrate-binding protein [Acerihabitans arboris]